MRNQLFEELAKLYGIEIQYGLKENAGFYYTDSNDTLQKLDTIFDEEFSVPRRETISVEECSSFDTFSIMDTSISEAA